MIMKVMVFDFMKARDSNVSNVMTNNMSNDINVSMP